MMQGGALEEYASQLETAIYLVVTVIMLMRSIIWQEWSGSWLASPITWTLFAVLRLISKKLCEDKSKDFRKTAVRMLILAAGLTIDAVESTWVAFPAAWMLVSALLLYDIIHMRKLKEKM